MDSLRWRPIEDLPADWQSLASDELASLAPIWKEQKGKLDQTGVLKEFSDRLGREWAIETGIIENLYSIDRGVTQLLIEKGIETSLIPHGTTDKPAEHIVAILRDHEDVLEGLFDFVASRRSMTTAYIKEVHAALTRNQHTVAAVNGLGRSTDVELLRGEWKRLPNNPTRPDGEVHEYCPPEQVAAEMDRVVAWHAIHTDRKVPPEVEAAWLHHRMTQIHPFHDGNGRVARALASLIFLRAEWFPLVVDRDNRSAYIEALEQADRGDLRSLVSLFSIIEKRSFLRALRISDDVLRGHQPVHQVIAAAIDRLKARFEQREEEQRRVFGISVRLVESTRDRLEEVAREFNKQITHVDDDYFASVDYGSPEQFYWFKKQIVEIAKKHEYFADTRTYGAWVRLKLSEERQVELVISFHSVGRDFVGILAASAFLEFRDRTDEGNTSVEGPYELSKDVLQWAFNEDPEVVSARYKTWLDEVIVAGLDHWRRQI